LEKKESNFGKKKQEKRGNLEKKMKKNKKVEKKRKKKCTVDYNTMLGCGWTMKKATMLPSHIVTSSILKK